MTSKQMCSVVVLFFIICNQLKEVGRLTGVTPFAAETEEDILEMNKECNILYPKELWEGISPLAKELVELMTLRSQEERPTLEEALSHPWFKSGYATDKVLSSAIENMKKHHTK